MVSPSGWVNRDEMKIRWFINHQPQINLFKVVLKSLKYVNKSSSFQYQNVPFSKNSVLSSYVEICSALNNAEYIRHRPPTLNIRSLSQHRDDGRASATRN
eukprot:sb/3478588/